MKIKGIQTTHVEMDVSKRELINSVCTLVRKKHKIPNGAYLNSKQRIEVWYDTHGSGITEQIRVASASDIQAFNAINVITDLLTD